MFTSLSGVGRFMASSEIIIEWWQVIGLVQNLPMGEIAKVPHDTALTCMIHVIAAAFNDSMTDNYARLLLPRNTGLGACFLDKPWDWAPLLERWSWNMALQHVETCSVACQVCHCSVNTTRKELQQFSVSSTWRKCTRKLITSQEASWMPTGSYMFNFISWHLLLSSRSKCKILCGKYHEMHRNADIKPLGLRRSGLLAQNITKPQQPMFQLNSANGLLSGNLKHDRPILA